MIALLRRHSRAAYKAVHPVVSPTKDIAMNVTGWVGGLTIWLFTFAIACAGGTLRLLTKREFWIFVFGFAVAQTMMLGSHVYRNVVDDYSDFINSRRQIEVHVPPLSEAESTPYTEDELYCLARVVFGEAKGESVRGKRLVAMTVINRALSSQYASDLCRVVQQDQQFHGYLASMNLAVKADFDAFIDSYSIARETLKTYVYAPNSERSILFFHADYVRPAWARSMERAFVEGRHIFYRPGLPVD